MIPIILAVLLSFLLVPVANFLRRLHLGRVPSALLAVVLALGIILVFGTVIGTQLAELAQEVPRYASSVERKIETLQSQRSATSQRSRVVSVMNSRTTVTINDAARRLSQLFPDTACHQRDVRSDHRHGSVRHWRAFPRCSGVHSPCCCASCLTSAAHYQPCCRSRLPPLSIQVGRWLCGRRRYMPLSRRSWAERSNRCCMAAARASRPSRRSWRRHS